MSTISLPTLSSAGFVRDPAVILDRQLSYFFIADYSQSNQHLGRVASLPFLIKNHAHQPDILVDRIQNSIEGMLSAYFESVSINVELTEPFEDAPQFDIALEGTVTQNGNRYGIARLLTISNSTLQSVAELAIK
jgi:hypothetical protein